MILTTTDQAKNEPQHSGQNIAINEEHHRRVDDRNEQRYDQHEAEHDPRQHQEVVSL